MGKSGKVGEKEAVLDVNAENSSPTTSWSIPQLKEHLRSHGERERHSSLKDERLV